MRIPSSETQPKPISVYSIDQILGVNRQNNSNDVQNNNFQSDHESVLDVENDDYPLISDLDVADHDPNDMGRPRKIKR